MELYFAPFACSMAARIALYEAQMPARFVEVDTATRRTLDGRDYGEIHPLGLVPALRTDAGEVITENAAVLQYVCDASSTREPLARARLQQWLSFIGTELHKALFNPHFDPEAPEQAKLHASRKGASRLAYVDGHLAGREFLLDAGFSVADAYLFTVLNWSRATPVSLEPYPALQELMQRLARRPSVAKAFQDELVLYEAQQARRAS